MNLESIIDCFHKFHFFNTSRSCFNNPPFVIFPHKKISDRRVLLGKTFGGRYLFVVFQHKSNKIARPIHARDMKMNEFISKSASRICFRKDF